MPDPSSTPRPDDPPPAAERGRLKGAPVDGSEADNPADPKREERPQPPRPDAP